MFWIVFDKGGSSSSKDRIKLLKRVIQKLGNRKQILNYRIVIKERFLFASVKYAEGAKEAMIVVSNEVFDDALKLYRWRWGIETLFGCLKSRGFKLEDTHMTDPAKLEKLIFVLAIAFCWAYIHQCLLCEEKTDS